MNKKVSHFKNLTDVFSNVLLEDILTRIKSGEVKNEINKIRTLIADGGDAGELKKKLPSFTVTGTFKGKRSKQNIDQYSSMLILDYDKLSVDQMEKLREQLVKLEYVYSFFVSPSGKGIKVIVAVDTGLQEHEKAFKQVVKMFTELFEIPIDCSGKDVSRLCFMSYDPNLYINTDVSAFKVQVDDSLDFEATFFQAVQITQKKFTYSEGNRNNFIHHLGCNANRLGIPLDVLITTVIEKYDLGEDEITRTVKGAYSNNENENGVKKGKKNNVDVVEEMLLTRYEFRYNEITLRTEFIDKQKEEPNFEPLTDYVENSILRWLLKKGVKISQSLLRSIIRSDFSKPFNAFDEYFNNLPKYTGDSDYIKELAYTVKTHNDELWLMVLTKWLVGMVACATTDSINHTVLVLAGGQGIGKTTWLLNLIPPELKIYVYSGMVWPNNRDTLVQLSECVLINMDELETLNKSEIGSLREIITKDSIRTRKAYGHNNENLTRRASFSGSVNTLQFMNDATGSRRFLCFEASEIDYGKPLNHKGIYSQALHLFSEGYEYWLNPEEQELVTQNNDQFQIVSPEEELLLAYFEPRAVHESDLFLTNSEILNRINFKACISNQSVRPRALGAALLKQGFIRLKRNGQQVYAVYEKNNLEIDEQFKNK